MKQLIERELGQLTFAANQTSTLQLPRDYSYDQIKLRLRMRLYRAAGASAGAPRDLSGAQIVKRIEVRKNGREVLKSIDMETLMRLNQIRYNTQPKYDRKVYSSQADVTTQWDAFAAVTTGANAIDFDLNALLDFGMWQSIRRHDTLLDSTARGNVSTLDLVITWGAYNDVMTSAYDPAAGGVAADVVPTLYISSGEYIDIDTADDPYGNGYMTNKEYGIRKVITADNPRELIELGVGNFYRSLVLKTTADDVLVNTILGREVAGAAVGKEHTITLRSGTDVRKYKFGSVLQAENKVACGVETWPTGYYLLELCPDGHLAKMLNTTNLSSLTLEFDVKKQGTSCVLEVFPVEVVAAPVRKTAA